MASNADLTARAALTAISGGAITAVELVQACLGRIQAADGDLGAFAHVATDQALAEAEARDRQRKAGLPLGPLHGLPVALKDVIDAQGMPCEHGTVLDAGRRPGADATLVRRLRNAGAVILGKTVTTELCYLTPRGTRNPHRATHTPGGSSSGSAAAVAAGMVPLAFGTQTNGSVIRPASFCGVVGFKPSFGAIPRAGVLTCSPSLDTVGVFARSVEDASLIDAILGPDAHEGRPMAPLTATALAEPPLRPLIAWAPGPAWDRAAPGTAQAFGELTEALGGLTPLTLPAPFAQAAAQLRQIMAAEMAHHLGAYVDRGGDLVSPAFQALVAEGRGVTAAAYLAAREAQTLLREALLPVFQQVDVILTPAAPGEAPADLTTTGDPSFCTLWSFTGLPAVTLPLLTGPSGLPMGVQLIGPPGDDARLLRTARWLVRHLME